MDDDCWRRTSSRTCDEPWGTIKKRKEGKHVAKGGLVAQGRPPIQKIALGHRKRFDDFFFLLTDFNHLA